MEIPKTYEPSKAESKWYPYWMQKGYFNSTPDEREPYTVVIPPPNVTGVLHMGHMLNNTIQDVLVRRARMLGKNACWVPGTDHASIATEAKVVQKLKSEGISKADLSRDEFLKHAFEWKDKHGGIILEQLKNSEHHAIGIERISRWIKNTQILSFPFLLIFTRKVKFTGVSAW